MLGKNYKNSFIEKRNALNKKTYRFNFTISEADVPAAAKTAQPAPLTVKPATADKKVAKPKAKTEIEIEREEESAPDGV